MEATYIVATEAYNKGYYFHISSSNKYIIKSISLAKSWYTPEELLLIIKEHNNAQDKLYTQYILLRKIRDTNVYEPSSLTPFYSYNLLEQKEFFLSFRAIDGRYRGDIHVNEFQLTVTTVV